MRNFRRQLENIIDNYILDPIIRQELLVDFLLVYLDFQPTFFMKDTDLDFIQRVEDLGFQVIIKDGKTIIVNPTRFKYTMNSYTHSDQDILQSVFIFRKNGIETKHLVKWYNPTNLEEQLPKTAVRLTDVCSIDQFSDFEICLNLTCRNRI
jgi:hypothetical protein